MPLDPIHTIRAAKRLHLKDGVFVSFSPVGVFSGHLRSMDGRVAWMGGASAVERGEEVLECWRQVILPALPLCGLDPLFFAFRGSEPIRAADSAALELEFTEAEHRNFAIQLFVECAMNGVASPVLNLMNAGETRVRATVDAAVETGVRAVLECARVAPFATADGRVRVISPLEAPRVSFAQITEFNNLQKPALLCARPDDLPDAFALVRALEAARPGFGFACLDYTYQTLTRIHGAPLGAFSRGAFFDILFLDYEAPDALTAANIHRWILRGFPACAIEAVAVATQPIVRRHEILTADRAAVAHAVAQAVARVRKG